MRPYIPLFLTTLAVLTAAQDDRTLLTDFAQYIGVANGGIGGTGLCKIEGNLDRGNQPIHFSVQETCDKFQQTRTQGPKPITFDENPDLTLTVSCDVNAGHCGDFFDIRVETTDGYCNQGRTFRVECPETDFKKRSGGSVLDARQEPPIQQVKQCYSNYLLVECFN